VSKQARVHVPDPFAYRPDIDGLRAIAVTSVVAYHAGIKSLAGGFTGVDIFFVISGFLIGGHIYREAVLGKFSFADFYARRARRIVPALVFMLACTFVAGVLMLTPIELRQLGQEAVAAILGLSNVLYYSSTDYFAPPADRNPLLMTWSLGVEEQFYLLFPILMLAVIRWWRRALLPVLAILSLASLVGSLVLIRHDPNAAFYLLPPRAWELGLGAWLAIIEQREPTPLPRAAVEVGAASGVLALLAGLFFYRPEFGFPGWFALIPTLGTAMLIGTRTSTINRVLLGAKPMAAIGLVSYSWYLWHWPVLYFYRLFATPAGIVPIAALILGTLGCGYLSWRFVERPFRQRTVGRGQVLIRYAGLIGVIAAAGFLFYKTNGWIGRLPAEARPMATMAMSARADECLAPYGARTLRDPARCLPSSGGKPRLIIWGDSHAAAISPGFQDLAQRSGLAFGQMTKSSCPPLTGAAMPNQTHASHLSECLSYQQAAMDYLRAHPEITTVVLTGYWSSDMDPRGSAGPVPLATALDRTITAIEAMGKRVVLVQDVPIFMFDPYARVVGDHLALRAALSRLANAPAGMRATDVERRGDPARPIVAAALVTHPRVQLIDPYRNLCNRFGCAFAAPGTLYYSDVQHLVAAGANEALKGVTLQEATVPLADPATSAGR
jgi:peptidoglycan/LPS O-acetylase OafA/YrhL